MVIYVPDPPIMLTIEPRKEIEYSLEDNYMNSKNYDENSYDFYLNHLILIGCSVYPKRKVDL